MSWAQDDTLTIKKKVMQKVSFKKLSILGLVLMAASAVTAAIAPSSKEEKVAGFTVTVRTDDSVQSTASCRATNNVGLSACKDDSVTGGFDSGTTDGAIGSDGATTMGA